MKNSDNLNKALLPRTSNTWQHATCQIFSGFILYPSSSVSLALNKRQLLKALLVICALGSLLGLSLVLSPRSNVAAQSGSLRSAFCHVTDGVFTVCPDGNNEWSDVPPKFFPESNSYLYADQADLDPSLSTPQSPVDTFVLMYDECARTVPLGPDEYFLISFKTVEVEDGKEKLEHYVIHVFTNGTIMFFDNGILQPPGRAPMVEGQRGTVGFGPSPNCATPHVIAEFEIKLSAANVILDGAYSPDPLFWGSAPPPTPTPTPCPPEEFTTIPVVVNILKNAGITVTEAGNAVRDASSILDNANKNLNVRLQIVGVNTDVTDGDDGSGGGTAGDGDLTPEEGDKVIANGDKEIGRLKNKKGIKVTFARTPEVGTGTTGFSVHRDPSIVVSKTARPGQTIAHEIGHVLTLSPPNFPHSSDGNNLMFTFFSTTATSLTDEQAHEICKNGFPNHGKTVTRKSPGQKKEQQYGAETDDIDDIAPSVAQHFDLYRVMMNSEVGAANIDTVLALHGAFPTSGPVDATYRLLFDADGDVGTGIAVGGFSGVDKEVRIHVTGDASLAPLTVSGVVFDHTAGGTQTPLPSTPQLFGEPRLDGNSPSVVQTQFKLPIPKSLLNFSTMDVPVGVVSQNSGSMVQDTMSLIFDQNVFQDDPTLTLTQERANMGQSVPFTIIGLEPNSSFALSLNDDQVLSGTLNSTGGFTGSFVVPSVPSGNYFLTAQDSTGEFAFNAIEIVPPLPMSPNMINNGIVQLGINNEGHLNVPGGLPSSGTGTTFVGLRFLPTGADATAPGCLCEGWGVADATSRVTGFANIAIDGVRNITLLNYASTALTAVSTVQIGNTFRVTHDYHPSSTPNLYEATVIIENITSADVDVRYRRVMDWDVEPTAFSEFVTIVTIQGTTRAANVLFSSDNGFASANPLSGPSSILFTGDAMDSGPADHGALFDFGFGMLAPGKKVSFNIYYGAAATESEALAALAAVRAEVYSFGQPNTPDGPTLGKPNTFIFAFAKVGGGPIVPLDSDGDGVLDELDNCPRTPNPGQLDSNLNGIGDTCETSDSQFATAAFLQAITDARTVVEPTSILVANTPSLSEQLRRIVQFRIDAGLTDSPEQLTINLVDGLVEVNLVAPGEANALVNAVLQQVVIPVMIDITPGSFPNSINPNDRGKIPVAILSNSTFSAPDRVNRMSLTFGRTGDEQSLIRSSLEDVNGDGRLDIVCHFDTQKAAFQSGDTQGTLKGRTVDGIGIIGTDTVRIVPPLRSCGGYKQSAIADG
jgi:hypothetical protein